MDISVDVSIDEWTVATAVVFSIASSFAILPVDIAYGFGAFIGAILGGLFTLLLAQVIWSLITSALPNKYKPGLFTHRLWHAAAIVGLLFMIGTTVWEITNNPLYQFSGEITTTIAFAGLYIGATLAVIGAVVKGIVRLVRDRTSTTDEATA